MEYDIRSLNVRLKTLKHNQVIYVNLPKNYCKLLNLEASEDEYVEILVHKKHQGSKVINLCNLVKV